ncbi:tetratricopeptide repeat protein [Leptospira sp. WS4.C2]|uniref:Tetratricopeptide repeat protein n=1 Tax=Leptospira vanthielii serovar Holland str. Waz Holland = ATCC 700522 TaxID=1218591 RepID=N1VVG5_9LEPT|nr:tetratricopeptide repeat protein [Leptospira vanthielii]EMY67964.1 tetratricopeptide repeat protein [Leptospira vanthielii serovar Holland str. Waz Holland = ATCC 700522]
MAEETDYLGYMNKGNYAMALNLLDQALLQNPEDPILLYNFALCCFQTKNFKKSIQVLDRILEEYPGFIEVDNVYRLKVFALVELKDWETAESIIKDRLQVAVDDPKLLSFLAHVYEYTHRLEEAIEIHRRILKHTPDYKNSLNSLGYLLALKKKISTEERTEAIKSLKKALELDPNNPAYLDSFGYFLQTIGKPEEAWKAYRKALQKNPNHPVLLERLKNLKK